MMRALFVGESWPGSCARSLKEALSRQPDIDLEEVNEDAFFLKGRSRLLRGAARLLHAECRRAFEREIIGKVTQARYDVLIAYKGYPVSAELIRAVRERGARTVNVYPDCSPWAYGEAHRLAVGVYDLVISTKPFHPTNWRSAYGYDNDCVCVPQGYDPALHLAATPPGAFDFDVAMVATFRPEYGRLIAAFATELADAGLRVVVGGNGWGPAAKKLPATWIFPGAVLGRSYVSLLRHSKICIAPLMREVFLSDKQLGDVDSTRTYELAAAHCFFIHRRTEYLQTIYDEATEVPMFDDAAELARHVRYFLTHEEKRQQMAAAAHHRAVPAYSLDVRAKEIVRILAQPPQVARS